MVMHKLYLVFLYIVLAAPNLLADQSHQKALILLTKKVYYGAFKQCPERIPKKTTVMSLERKVEGWKTVGRDDELLLDPGVLECMIREKCGAPGLPIKAVRELCDKDQATLSMSRDVSMGEIGRDDLGTVSDDPEVYDTSENELGQVSVSHSFLYCVFFLFGLTTGMLLSYCYLQDKNNFRPGSNSRDKLRRPEL